jgi:hypothetical protein
MYILANPNKPIHSAFIFFENNRYYLKVVTEYNTHTGSYKSVHACKCAFGKLFMVGGKWI